MVAIFTQRVLARQPIQINARRTHGDAGCVRDYVFVGDVVRYNQLAIDGGIDEPVVNVCTGEATTHARSRAHARQGHRRRRRS